MELIGTEYKYDLAMNVTGFACNVLLRAYKTENGERVYYPDFDVPCRKKIRRKINFTIYRPKTTSLLTPPERGQHCETFDVSWIRCQ